MNRCHRSTLAYGPLVDDRAQLGSLGFVACSGSVTADLFHANANRNRTPAGTLESAQLCRETAADGVDACAADRAPAVGTDTRTVTLTIGGNDVGFADIVRSCAWITVAGRRVGLPGAGCSKDPLLLAHAAQRLAALNAVGSDVQSPYGTTIHSLASVLATIHTAAPNAHVFIAGYPKLFQPEGDADCVIGTADRSHPIKITATDARWLDAAAGLLDASIAFAAAQAGPWATYVDAADRFSGHGLCGTNRWINPVSATVSLQAKAPRISATVDPGSVHPTVQGQADGYADAFLAAGIATGLTHRSHSAASGRRAVGMFR